MNWPKIDSKYLKEAFKEPINFWGMAGFLVGAVFFQDVTPLLLGLGTEARMNLPNSTEGNWAWRYDSGQLRDEIAARLRKLTELYGRSHG